MDQKSKIILGLVILFIGIASYAILGNSQFLSSSVSDLKEGANNARSSIQSDLSSSSVGSPSEPILKLEQVTLDDINQYRQANNVPPLTMMNEAPSSTYANALLDERCLHHVQDNGTTPQGRFHNSGLDSFLVGENLSGGQKAVFENLEDFIKKRDSDMMFNDADSNWGHRKNILDPTYMSVSIGIAYDATNMVIVEDFLQPLQSGEYIPTSEYQDIPDAKKCW